MVSFSMSLSDTAELQSPTEAAARVVQKALECSRVWGFLVAPFRV